MSVRVATVIVTTCLLAGAVAWDVHAQRRDAPRREARRAAAAEEARLAAEREVGEECTLALERPRATSAAHATTTTPPVITSAPRGRSLGALARDRCEGMLRGVSVPFESVASVAGVEQPLRLRGPIREGVWIRAHGREPRLRAGAIDPRLDAVLDCRLVVALHTWTAWVREAGFVGIEHISVFRPHSRVASTGRPSGHATAMAIDVLALVRPDGTRFTILDDWVQRERGGDPCLVREETEEQARVRQLACRGMREGLFQVVITPHNDDRHANHLHLEVRPDVDWAIIR